MLLFPGTLMLMVWLLGKGVDVPQWYARVKAQAWPWISFFPLPIGSLVRSGELLLTRNLQDTGQDKQQNLMLLVWVSLQMRQIEGSSHDSNDHH